MPAAAERFSGLFERTHQPLLTYALRRVADRADAADVVADTFLVAWRRLDDIPVDHERAWLFGVARRVLANHRRGARRRHAVADRLRLELSAAPPPATTPPAQTLLGLALDQLTEADRELLHLVAWEELGSEEIAVVLGISGGAVRVRLHRARQRLQAALDALHALDPDTVPTPTTALTDSARRTR
jgi:RNA polymerase sigma-70 factor (ECF subfamily)